MTIFVRLLLGECDVHYTCVADDASARFERHAVGTNARYTRICRPTALLDSLSFDQQALALANTP